MEIAIMLEGQMGVNWPRWQRIARAVEDLGFVGLYRSDHFTNADGPMQDSLDLWASLLWLADNTSRIEFGPLVSPVSFRHPAHTIRFASAVDDLSGGRLTLGLGAGWQAREHESYSFDLLPVPARFQRFEEALTVIHAMLTNADPVNFDGTYYQFKNAELAPRPARSGGPPILIGGNGPQRTLPLVARFAQEWNAVYLTPETYAKRRAQLETLLTMQQRDPKKFRYSMMVGMVFGQTEAQVDKILDEYGGQQRADLRARGMLVGTGPTIAEQIAELEAAGVQRIMIQWFNLDDLDGLAAFAQAVL